jgi:hypothetical protein
MAFGSSRSSETLSGHQPACHLDDQGTEESLPLSPTAMPRHLRQGSEGTREKRGLCPSGQRAIRALAPFIRRSTSEQLAVEVSPGVDIASAP